MIAWILWGASWLLAVDAVRRPGWQWTSADRNRPFWVTLLVVLGPLTAVVYLVAVLPRLLSAHGTTTTDKRFLGS